MLEEGKLLVAGPTGEAGGIVILCAASAEDAQAIMAADPAVASGLFAGELQPFLVRFAADPTSMSCAAEEP